MKAVPKKRVRSTRDLERTRREILTAAFPEIFRRGFQGVSIDDVVRKTNLTKGAFYHQFPTKLDLGYAVVEEVIMPMILERWIAPLGDFENPLTGILDRLDTLIGRAPASELALGCPLNNLVQEMAPIDPGFRRRLRSGLELWIGALEEALTRGQASGFVRRDLDLRQVATFIVMTHEGYYGILKGLGETGLYASLVTPLREYFQSLAGKPKARRG